MKTFMNKNFLVAASIFATAITAQAQYLRTSYFMEGASTRVQMNPGLQPTRGYLNLPLIGGFNVTANTNSLGINDIIDITKDGNDFLNNNTLYNSLQQDNRFNLNLNTNLLSFGWIKGKNFWSVNAGLRMDIGAQINKDMFTMMRTMNSFDIDNIAGREHTYKMGNQSINMNAYAEVGLGLSRRITEKLTVGARAKVLLGLARTEVNIEQFDLNLEVPEVKVGQEDFSEEDWYGKNYSYDAKANVVTTLKGGGMTFDPATNMINGFDLDASSFGIAGTGFGVDLGASYSIFNNLTVSAAVLDLGVMKWNKNNTTMATVEGHQNVTISEDNYDQYIGGDFLSLDRFDFKKDEEADYKSSTKLSTTILLAAEYGLLNNKLSVGAVYSSRFVQPKTQTELTFLATLRPSNAFNAAISYSPILSGGKSFGLALKLGPIFAGTDYMYFGGNSKTINGFIGLSLPLGGKRKPFSEL
ncbi:hypothetical protein H6A66_03450 [Bacteroides caecigallinarum]|uniref:DUF5723 family protein n=1 Tax=Bacteroides caecigallinarum TaxID=1411144 RepID=UPI00195C6A3F|nr:DUF5723 family protein [Bacteroides caecigallinarum]MBM6864234.1 hypothetical protein [Bacteroides caecigallinarum]